MKKTVDTLSVSEVVDLTNKLCDYADAVDIRRQTAGLFEAFCDHVGIVQDFDMRQWHIIRFRAMQQHKDADLLRAQVQEATRRGYVIMRDGGHVQLREYAHND